MNEHGTRQITQKSVMPKETQFDRNSDIQQYLNISLCVSELAIKIRLVSCVVNTSKLISSFIEQNDYIKNYTWQTETTFVIDCLSSDAELLSNITTKPIQPTENIFVKYDNSSEILFFDNDIAAGFIYDQLIHATSSIRNYFMGNIILENIKNLICNINPLFITANVVRLLGREYPALRKYSIVQLSDICSVNAWNTSVEIAQEIYESIDKQIRFLAVPSDVINELTVCLDKRQKYVIENRYFKADKTLEEIGSELDLTRERIRQIALKAEKRFKSYRSRELINSLFSSLKVLCECEYCFTIDELDKFGISESALTFLIEMLGDGQLLHIPDTNYITFSDENGKCEWFECMEQITCSMPKLLLPNEQQSIMDVIISLVEEFAIEIPENIITTVAFRQYFKSGSILIKKSLRMGDRYEIVLEKFFPDGIRLHQDMGLFRWGYAVLFDDDKIPDNDHAIASRVADRCIIIDRGTYILNKRTVLPSELAQQILDYILWYPFEMVMTNAIMHKFYSELTVIGIDNKYYLHSILKQHFSDKFNFRRDYVVKGENTGNFYKNITAYVEANIYGISFYDLQVYFQGIPNTVIYLALSEDDNIIPMRSKMYTHKKHIIFPERSDVLGFLQDVVLREHIVSSKRVFNLIKQNYPDFIANNNINSSWFLFSILRSFFEENFKFSRPHIIEPTFDSANGRDALRNSFWGKKYVEISDIKKYAKEKQIQIYDLSKLLNSYKY